MLNNINRDLLFLFCWPVWITYKHQQNVLSPTAQIFGFDSTPAGKEKRERGEEREGV
jgi:hypothetical protein